MDMVSPLCYGMALLILAGARLPRHYFTHGVYLFYEDYLPRNTLFHLKTNAMDKRYVAIDGQVIWVVQR